MRPVVIAPVVIAPVVVAPVVVAPVVIARSGSDEAIPGCGINRIAASLSLLAMTTGAMTTKGSSAPRPGIMRKAGLQLGDLGSRTEAVSPRISRQQKPSGTITFTGTTNDIEAI
jgi:hypothetical protein